MSFFSDLSKAYDLFTAELKKFMAKRGIVETDEVVNARVEPAVLRALNLGSLQGQNTIATQQAVGTLQEALLALMRLNMISKEDLDALLLLLKYQAYVDGVKTLRVNFDPRLSLSAAVILKEALEPAREKFV